MNIEDKLAYIRKALELGAKVGINFYFIENKEKAAEIMVELQPAVQVEYDSNDGTHWCYADDYDNQLETTVFYQSK
ncbi:hypothetical protein [Neobacillus mesonae]|uniref:hypothetical protein n=1 Tax=Neobacillus mesonae TaxID=1193713 RepID=UPI00203ADD88|nr:hypothetical protein [Neobacillus mesonae]MCM3567882.1 hypothetical protein [Neobacillus mesonae]